MAAQERGRRVEGPGARRLEEGEAPRLENVVKGLAGDRGMEPPSLWVIEKGGPNALVAREQGPSIAVTQSLLDDYTRTELEAVVAHCLVRLELGHSRGQGVPPGPAEDARTAAFTRYPPGLASALAKAEPRPDKPAGAWMVPAVAPTPVQERVELVSDL